MKASKNEYDSEFNSYNHNVAYHYLALCKQENIDSDLDETFEIAKTCFNKEVAGKNNKKLPVSFSLYNENKAKSLLKNDTKINFLNFALYLELCLHINKRIENGEKGLNKLIMIYMAKLQKTNNDLFAKMLKMEVI